MLLITDEHSDVGGDTVTALRAGRPRSRCSVSRQAERTSLMSKASTPAVFNGYRDLFSGNKVTRA
jgi:hypothetical protein